ncbi:hypothetical protein [Pseudoclavibacter helvolus]|uniref:hypothetical protein n=1 Tax=Pseudoclavibacter helvolus TaxID=255205 RepID=UPI0024AD54F9|nr:hypothetical protein [Pseudoclavibacter helvolus]
MADKYEELAAQAESEGLAVKPDSIRRGAWAAHMGQELLVAATGAQSPEEATQLALGRPRAGSTKKGASPTIRARVPQALKDGVRAVAAAEGRDESEVVRTAVAAYVQERGMIA